MGWTSIVTLSEVWVEGRRSVVSDSDCHESISTEFLDVTIKLNKQMSDWLRTSMNNESMGDGPVETFCGFLDFPMFTVLFLTQFRHSFVYFSPLSWRPLPLWYFTHWNHTRPPIHLPDSGSVEKRSGPGQKTQTFGHSRVVHMCIVVSVCLWLWFPPSYCLWLCLPPSCFTVFFCLLQEVKREVQRIHQGILSSFFLGIDWFDSWSFGLDYQVLW